MKSGGTPARRSIARGTSALFFAKSAESLENKWDKVLASAKMRKRVRKNMKRKAGNRALSEQVGTFATEPKMGGRGSVHAIKGRIARFN